MGFGCAGSNPDRHIYVFGFVRDCYVLLFLQRKNVAASTDAAASGMISVLTRSWGRSLRLLYIRS
jgi:hypothetical protein